MKKKIQPVIVFILFVAFLSGCSGVNQTIDNAQRLKFKLGSVDNFNLAGVKLNNVSSLNDINILDGAALLAAFTGGKMPASFYG